MNTRIINVANIVFGFYCSVTEQQNQYTVKDTITNNCKTFTNFADALNEMYEIKKKYKQS